MCAGESRKQRAAAAAAAAEAAAKGTPLPQEQIAEEDLVYDDYEPVVTALQGGERHCKSFPTFDAALAEFYSKVEGQRAGVQKATAKKQVLSKLDKARAEQEERVAALVREADAEENQVQYVLTLSCHPPCTLHVVDDLHVSMGRSCLTDLRMRPKASV